MHQLFACALYLMDICNISAALGQIHSNAVQCNAVQCNTQNALQLSAINNKMDCIALLVVHRPWLALSGCFPFLLLSLEPATHSMEITAGTSADGTGTSSA